MKVLLVGSGAREHMLAMSISASPQCEKLIVAPGNAGIAQIAELAPIASDDIEELCTCAQKMSADLVVIGPEVPLAKGLADKVRERGILCFGPSSAAARIESSKVFAKAFMERHHIPTAQGKNFSDRARAKEWIIAHESPVVIKASGLAAGKGVVIPKNTHEALHAIDMLWSINEEIVIEEKLEGEELSLIALCDGERYAVLPAAQDHKRLLDGGQGPNTGGMGAYAPVGTMEETEALARIVIKPALEGLAQEGTPFVGALYAGLMLTSSGPKVLEYNARFGDPETQAILPLFSTDLLPTLAACAQGQLEKAMPTFARAHAVCVVLASKGYPERAFTGNEIEIGVVPGRAFCAHAGTKRTEGKLVSSGGRVLSIIGTGDSLDEARACAYDAIERIRFEGMQFRHDIAAHAAEAAIATTNAAASIFRKQSLYAHAGVDIDAGNSAVELIKDAVKSTYTAEVIAGIGAFGGQFDGERLKKMSAPVLVASTDGVGTKTSLGLRLGRLEDLGIDMVNHSINDILVQGAMPLFFMDYIAADRLHPEKVAQIVRGMAYACKEAHCVLLGGETAEMPGTYREGEMDIAATIVGVVDRSNLLPRKNLEEGDLLVGLKSSGLHTNGYSLARAIVDKDDLTKIQPELGESLADALLRPHRSYLPILQKALQIDPSPIKALAHITGGGLIENIPRVLPATLDARIRVGSWSMLPVFSYLQRAGKISDEEMRRVFNVGIGMVAIVEPAQREHFLSLVPEPAMVIGELIQGNGKVVFG